MSPHNKRSKAKQSETKERRAAQHSQRTPHGARSHKASNNAATAAAGYGVNRPRSQRHAPAGTTSYLSNRPNERPSRGKHTFDDPEPLDQQLFDYLIVVDVEATCAEGQSGLHFPHEVIELPAILVDVRRGVVDKARSFRTFIKPQIRPQLTQFCTDLTGIQQSDVDAAPTMPQALELFERWYRSTIPRGAKVVCAADGPWDFKKFLYEGHVLRDRQRLPSIFYEYLDIRTTFAHVFNRGTPMKLEPMLRRMGLNFDGRPHCGFDDAYNIARLAVAMMRAGCVFDFLACIPLEPDCYYAIEGYPLYRRAEGSGYLDRDVVDDIAKQCFGADYFRFGETHRVEVQRYRTAHPRLFAHTDALQAGRKVRQKRLAASSRVRLLLQVAILFAALIVVALVVGCYLRLRRLAQAP